MSKILESDVLAAARLIRGIEDEVSDEVKELDSAYLHTGRAYIVGVAGAPGVGKSTLLGSLINIRLEIAERAPKDFFNKLGLLGTPSFNQTQGRSFIRRGDKDGLFTDRRTENA